MVLKATVMTVLVLFALGVPWVVDNSFAAPIPAYFADEWVGFACVTATIPGGSVALLLQLNFDKIAGGGISLPRADELFAQMTSPIGLGWLGGLLGASLQVTCAHTPGQIQASNPGLTALQAAQAVSGDFQQRGFATYVIQDTFLSLAQSYLGLDIPILRTDAFPVLGSNNVSYLGSIDVVDTTP
jgi:hypothetical protein